MARGRCAGQLPVHSKIGLVNQESVLTVCAANLWLVGALHLQCTLNKKRELGGNVNSIGELLIVGLFS